MPIPLFLDKNSNSSDADVIINKFLQKLLNDPKAEAFSSPEMFRLFNALFVQRDPILLHAFRQGLKGLLSTLTSKMASLEKSELMLSYILCLLPYAEMQTGEEYIIPERDPSLNVWLPVTYKVQPIELTPTWGPEAFVITDRERVFAYGLQPVQSLNEDSSTIPFKPSPILLLKGMPAPTGQGFATQWFANWFLTPGSWLMRTGHARLQTWLSTNQTPSRVFGFGQGGGQALELLFDEALKDHIAHVTAYNPSGLYALTSERLEAKWSALHPNPDSSSKPQVTIIHQQHDNSSARLGVLLPQWNIIKVTSPSNGQFLNHMLCYVTHADSQAMQRSEAEIHQENSDRWWLNLAVNHVGRSAIFALLALPCHFVVIPVVRALLQHKTEALILSLMIFASAMFPGMFAAPLGITLAVAASLYLGYKLLNPLLQRFAGLTPAPDAQCHVEEKEMVRLGMV